MKIEDILRAELLKGKSIDTILDETKAILEKENEIKIKNDKKQEEIEAVSAKLVDCYIDYLKVKDVDTKGIDNDKHKKHLVKILADLDISLTEDTVKTKSLFDIFPLSIFW